MVSSKKCFDLMNKCDMINLMLSIIITESYTGPDRRAKPRRREDRRKSIVVAYNEKGELSTKLGELLDIKC